MAERPSNNRVQALTGGPAHHFFGYYGISAWNRDATRHLALETDFHERPPGPDDTARVGLVDTKDGRFQAFGTTGAFNLQQGSMLHWIDAGFGEEFTYNDYADGRLVSRAVHPETSQKRTLEGALAAVSPREPLALGLNFVRMYGCRTVVGYGVDPAASQDITPRPDDDGLFAIDLSTGKRTLLLSIRQVLETYDTLDFDAKAPLGLSWFNHVLINPEGTRCLFFCRIRNDQGWWSSLWTCTLTGDELRCEIPFGQRISHFDWVDAQRLLVSSDVLDGEMQFVTFDLGQNNFTPFHPGIMPSDGHASFTPDRVWLVCDTYPRGPERLAELFLLRVENGERFDLGPFQHAEVFRGDVRCDLHPRWRPDSATISFDSVHEGSRQIYLADVADITSKM